MGYLSSLLKSERSPFTTNRADRGDGRRLWEQVFGNAGKEDLHKNPDVVPGGSYGKSAAIGTEASIARLLQAMRSMAPGGWTDNRYEQSRHFTGVNYIAIHRTGEQIAQSEFQVFRKDDSHPEGKVPVTKDDPPEGDRQCRPYDLVTLLERPNDDDSFGDLLYSWNQQLDLTGTALTWMVPNKLHTPFELYPIPTATAVPQPAINPEFPDGYYRIQPLYPYGPFSSYPTPTTAVGAPIPAQWMMRFKYTHPLLRYEGWSPLTALRLQSDSVEAIDKSRFYKMLKAINPDAVLQLEDAVGAQPLPESEIERIRVDFMNLIMGPENSGGLIVSPPGGRLETFGNSPKDMDWPAGWEQLMSFMMAGFGITKPAAGMIEDSSYSTLYATLKQFYWLTLEPKVNKIAAKLTRHLAPYFGDDLIVEIRCKRIDDHDVTFTKIDKGIAAKCVTKNEVRKELDFPVTKEEWGEEIAGYEKPPEQPGMTGTTPGPEGGQEDEEGLGPFAQMMQDDGEQDRPDSGKLSEGSLGPRMKSLYDVAVKALRNGHAKQNS